MRLTFKITITTLASLFIATTVYAHSLWVNSFDSFFHKPGHTMTSIGWGHVLPIDDLPNSVNGRINIDRFELFDPALNKTALNIPPCQVAKPTQSTANVDIYTADVAMQKIALKENSAPGVYQIGAVSVPTFYTKYIDKKGRTRMKMKPLNEVKDVDKIIFSAKYQAFAKSFMTLAPWSQPQALGHGLEIIPRTDLSNLHAGDLVEVDVLFNGKPLVGEMAAITAYSNNFGQPDGFTLSCSLKKGKGQFRVQSSGQWVIFTKHKDKVTEDGPFKDLYGKTTMVARSASLTFTVK
ncbi:MAG: DUF4198 domain-containing protein [Desulfobacterales bacterium]|nr:DUF4198 domain-containing protein [Desulfobacterales bacterium]